MFCLNDFMIHALLTNNFSKVTYSLNVFMPELLKLHIKYKLIDLQLRIT